MTKQDIEHKLAEINDLHNAAIDKQAQAAAELEAAEAAHQLTIRQEAIGEVEQGASKVTRAAVDQARDNLEISRVRVEVLSEQVAELGTQVIQVRIKTLQDQLDVICARCQNNGVKIDALVQELTKELQDLQLNNQAGFSIQSDIRILGGNAVFPGYRIVLGNPAYPLIQKISSNRREHFIGGAKLI